MEKKKKKARKITPTINQRRVIDKIQEQVRNGKKVSISKAMREVGYSKTTASTLRIKKTKGWKELLEQYLPDSLLNKRHRELLNKKELIRIVDRETGETSIERTDEPDTQAVKAALDMAYKLKGHYEPEKHTHTHSVSLKDLYNA